MHWPSANIVFLLYIDPEYGNRSTISITTTGNTEFPIKKNMLACAYEFDYFNNL